MTNKLWLTYAWKDNEDLDVDLIAQELTKVGLDVRLNRKQLLTGRRLWEQIDAGITKPEESDAWAIVVSKRSLESEPCREEIAYALDRALGSRGDTYPLMGIFVEQVESELVPSAIRTRLYVSTESSDWVERIRSGVLGELPNLPKEEIAMAAITLHRDHPSHPLIVEARPRTGLWNPCTIRIPSDEQNFIDGVIVRPARKVPSLGRREYRKGNDPANREWFLHDGGEEATASPTMSMYAFFNTEPSRLYIGPLDDLVEVDLQRTTQT